jgi:hypothetical protein
MALRIIIILCSFIFFSCKKLNENRFQQRITGDWELEKVSCECSTPGSFPAGNGQIISLQLDGTFERRLHDSVTFRGHYTIQKKKDCKPRPEKFFFETDETFPMSSYLEEQNEKLIFSYSNCVSDGVDMTYRRIK